MFTDDSSKVVYTLIEDITINDSWVLYTGNALQGIIKDYEVNGVTNITLDNLDSELRLFFTDKMIAQNGIFISDANKVENTWKLVDNLET
uniref:Baseplate wedge protein n=1 Tax=Siphoviridae sp. ctrpg19 TaxID=2826481 RepID=A0A8S5MKS2_9CAUD|nr:MAG TPA: Baseplate wedge protein [Siphoviridae sp. ctrpg19]